MILSEPPRPTEYTCCAPLCYNFPRCMISLKNMCFTLCKRTVMRPDRLDYTSCHSAHMTALHTVLLLYQSLFLYPTRLNIFQYIPIRPFTVQPGPTFYDTPSPSSTPTKIDQLPSESPTETPSTQPTVPITTQPSIAATVQPSKASPQPTSQASSTPSLEPTVASTEESTPEDTPEGTEDAPAGGESVVTDLTTTRIVTH